MTQDRVNAKRNMSSIHVKSNAKWKQIAINPQLFIQNDMNDFISLEELTDYDIIKDGDVRKKSKGKGKKSEKKPPKDSDDSSTSKLKKKTDEGHEPEKVKTNLNKEKVKKKRKNLKKNKKKEEPEKDTIKLNKKKGRMIQGDVEIVELNDEPTTKKRKQQNENTQSSPKKKQKIDKKNKKTVAQEVVVKDENLEASQKSEKLPDMSAWKNLQVPDAVIRALAEMGFTSPMPIQTLALPSAMRDRKDILGAAETGSGKTLAFGIPLLHHIMKFKENRKNKENVESEEIDEDNLGVLSEDANASDEEEENEGVEEEDEDEEENEEDHDLSDSEEEDMEDLSSTELPFDENEEAESDDEEEGLDLPPGEEDQLSELDDDEFGCVRAINNVTFDWLEEREQQKTPSDASNKPLLGLVLAPTRELAIQVKQHLDNAAKYTGIKIAAVVGGMAAQKQERLLKKCPEIVVATPGRLWELLQEGDPHLSKLPDVRYLVIDEADRMVEKGHFAELTSLLDVINSDEKKLRRRQTFVFSATLTMIHSGPNRPMKKKKQKMTSTSKLESLMQEIGIKEKPKIIDLSNKVGTAKSLVEARINCKLDEKDFYLYYLLQQYPGRTLVFTNSKDCVRRLVSVFTLLQCNPLPLHADMHQKQRLRNLDRFKGNERGFLLATDVAARGLDIPGVEHVVHYQVPRTTENYVHRSGRTARAYSEGLSVVLISPDELKDYRKIIRTLNREEELPVFPVEEEYMPGLKARVCLARQIDKEEHKVTKKQKENNWFKKAAEEMDIELDEEEFLNDLGDSREQAQHRHKVAQWRAELGAMIKTSIIPKRFSGKYPTKSGKLVLPYMKDHGLGGAVMSVKKEKTKTKKQISSDEAASLVAIKHKNKMKKNKNRK